MTKHSYDKEFKEQAVQYYLDNKDNLLKEIRKQLQLEDVENGDLINTDSDDQQVEKVVREIVAKWDYQRKNYFI
ncbi:MAG: protein rep [Limosilactobacillus fermentum]|uniref:protein rep n=1 Tax=Limosilactobacillus fermentum TaxID=1613 RepID=UPI0021CB937F|nr:protein rep [Limosilactobacillus fermentum]